MVECFDAKTNTCPIIGSCRLKGLLAEAVSAFYTSLNQFTLKDLVTGPHKRNMSRIFFGNVTP
jgi:Rrf2 family nitric oxide-sensitive transcriptional repressor